MEEQMRISDRLNQENVGRTYEVVCEGFDRYAECYYGRSACDAPEIDGKIFFESDRKVTVGEYVKVRTDDTLDYDLIGLRID
jgi:ribosomal protein S12 methylthiotransferase